MEALAALQLKKKKEKEANIKLQADLKQRKFVDGENVIEQRRLNEMFGYPREVRQIFAMSKQMSAAVWWIYDGELDNITGWEILRYRRDLAKPGEQSAFQYKGSHIFGKLENFQIIIPELSDNHEYRFSVKGINEKGKGLESKQSNIILIETPLPSGWFRFFDNNFHRPYYASIKSNRSSWKRPELDPFFVDDAIFLNFQDRELKHLKELFVEDLAHFGEINVDQFMDILSEIGEKQSKSYIRNLFITFMNDLKISTWTQYLEIVNHLKLQHINRQPIASCNLFVLLFNRAKVSTLLPSKRNKMGENWEMEFNTFAQRYYYKNSVTNQCFWHMPDEIKFYLPLALEEKLLTIFDIEEFEEMKQSFSFLDIDNSGDLSESEIKLLLNSLGIKINEKRLKKLMKAIDTNNNGTIEFDEFCWMMYEIKKKEKKRQDGLLKDMTFSSRSLSMRFQRSNSELYNDPSFRGKMRFGEVVSAITMFGNNNKGKRRLSFASSTSGDSSLDDSSIMVGGNPKRFFKCFKFKKSMSISKILADDDSASRIEMPTNHHALKRENSLDHGSVKGSPQIQKTLSFNNIDDSSLISGSQGDNSSLGFDGVESNLKKMRRKSSFNDMGEENNNQEEDNNNKGRKGKHSKHCYCGCRRY
jgi:Ca2+-binding EF-hand superfamily protein